MPTSASSAGYPGRAGDAQKRAGDADAAPAPDKVPPGHPGTGRADTRRRPDTLEG
jgi:hypothetical protein